MKLQIYSVKLNLWSNKFQFEGHSLMKDCGWEQNSNFLMNFISKWPLVSINFTRTIAKPKKIFLTLQKIKLQDSELTNNLKI